MKILLISERDELRDHIRRNFMPRGAEIIQYYHPIKAMDNLEEVDPDLVLFSAQDFPRHWKPFLVFLRDSVPRERCVFVILRGEQFDHEEADKAQALHVNGIVHEQLRDRTELSRLKELVGRYRDIGDMRNEKRLVPTEIDRLGFAFSHPASLELVTGRIEDISANGIALQPADRQRVLDLPVGALLNGCSLRVGDTILSLPTRVVRNDRALSLTFTDLSESQRQAVRRYVNEHGERQLHHIASDEPAPLEPV